MKCSVNRENIKSLLPSLHWGSSHPGPSQLRLPHPSTAMQPGLPRPPLPSCLHAFPLTSPLLFLEFPSFLALQAQGLFFLFPSSSAISAHGKPLEPLHLLSHSAPSGPPPHCPSLSHCELLHLVVELSPPRVGCELLQVTNLI